MSSMIGHQTPSPPHPYDEGMKKLILIAITAAGGIMVCRLLNSEYQPPPGP
jgi:hypothetical protein